MIVSLPRTALAALATGAALSALGATATTPAVADRPVVVGPQAEPGSFIGPVWRGQSALHARHASEPLGRKFH